MNGTTESKFERYYYIKSNKFAKTGQYIGCVCILRNPETGTFSRGISLCRTDKDNFNKKRARGIAFSRANTAMRAERNSELMDHILDATITNVGSDFLMKLYYIDQQYGLNPYTLECGRVSVNLSQPNAVLTKKEMQMWDDVINPYVKEEK